MHVLSMPVKQDSACMFPSIAAIEFFDHPTLVKNVYILYALSCMFSADVNIMNEKNKRKEIFICLLLYLYKKVFISIYI